LTPAQLAALRDALPALTEAGEASPLQRAYCRYYGIDFADTRPGLEHRLGTVSSGSHTLAVHRWLRAGAGSNLLLVHGYYDHSGLFGKLIDYGLARDCNVVMFDLPGHGLSSGEPAVIDDFSDYADAIADVLAAAQMPGLPLWVMAQSTGCAALVEFARRGGWPFAAAAMLAPLARPKGWRLGRLSHALVSPFTDSIARKFAANSSDLQFLQFLREDPLQSRRLSLRWVAALKRWLATLPRTNLGVGPVLIVQGDADQTVDWRYNIEFYRALFPGSPVLLLPGAGHQLANESVQLRDQYLNEVGKYIGDLMTNR